MTATAMIAWHDDRSVAASDTSQHGAVVTIAPAAAGTWRVSTNDNWFGGLFVSCKAAVAFALGEARRNRCAQIVIDVAPGQRLGG